MSLDDLMAKEAKSRPSRSSRSGGASGGACFTCGKQGHRAADCPKSSGGGGASRGACFTCGGQGHRASNCPNATGDAPAAGACFTCGGQGHRASNCPNAAAEDAPAAGACFTCGGQGHRASNCPNAAAEDAPAAGACFTCGGQGHRASNCPNGSVRGGRSSGPVRRNPISRGSRAAPYERRTEQRLPEPTYADPEDTWQHDMYDATSQAPRASVQKVNDYEAPLSTGTKIMITNLNEDILESDMEELFGNIGDIKSAVVHYDASGRSRGTAEVTFRKRADAVEAIEKYNGRELDGAPMRIHLMGSGMPAPRSQRAAPVAGVRGRGAGAASGMFAHAGEQRMSAPRAAPASMEREDVSFSVTMRSAPRGRGGSSFDGARGGRGAPRGGAGGACFSCGEEGHRAADCPSGGARRSGGGGGACFNCGGQGHRAANCPNGGGRGGRGGGRGGAGGGRGGRAPREAVSEADLDAEMDAYHSANK
jgi:hypothetical protein